jgi:diaminopimelate epimerase
VIFSKFSGAGNDFICTREVPEDVPALCARRTGIGADGVIVLEDSAVADVRMRLFNADGSEAAMCGNGLRCLHKFAGGGRLTVETLAGILNTWDEGEQVSCTMPAPTIHALRVSTELGTLDWIDTGVPHAILFVADVESAPVITVGRELRHHPVFGPPGANINFVQKIGPHHLAVRTYERGVEDETLACGTGACAAAVALCQREGHGNVRIELRSGDLLSIHYSPDRLEMTGPAHRVFDGQTTGQMVAWSHYG